MMQCYVCCSHGCLLLGALVSVVSVLTHWHGAFSCLRAERFVSALRRHRQSAGSRAGPCVGALADAGKYFGDFLRAVSLRIGGSQPLP